VGKERTKGKGKWGKKKVNDGSNPRKTPSGKRQKRPEVGNQRKRKLENNTWGEEKFSSTTGCWGTAKRKNR